MNGHGWGLRLGCWLNVEDHVPLYSLMVNFRIFIIRLFLSIRPVIIQALLHYLFLLPERWCLKYQWAWTVEHYESLSTESTGFLSCIPFCGTCWWTGLRKNTRSSQLSGLQLFIRFPCSWCSYQLPMFSPKILNIIGFWTKRDPFLILLFPEKSTPELL